MHYISRIILSVMVLGASFILVEGPRSEVLLPEDRRNDVVVQYWEKWTGLEERQMGEIVKDFNDTVGREKHIYVQYLSMSNIDQKTLVATAAGVPPDVAGLWHDRLVQLASRDALEPLENMAADHGITEGYYKPVYWKACHYDGHLIALISTPAAVALHYNTRLFRESAGKLRVAGLDPDRPPQTLAELDRYADALDVVTTDSDGRRHIERAGYFPTEPTSNWYIVNTPIWFGADIWDDANRRFTLTDPRVIAAFKWIQSYSVKFGREAVGEFATSQGGFNFNSPQNPFLAGAVVMQQQGPWMANLIHERDPSMDHDWAAAPFPSAVPGLKDVTFCPFDALVIPKGARHKAEAFEFIAYVNRQDVMEKLCSLHCKNSPLAKVSEYFVTHHRNPYIRVFEELAASPNAHSVGQCPIAPEAGGELWAIVQGIAAQTRDPQTALEDAQVRLQQQYEQFVKKQESAAQHNDQ